MFSDFKNKEIYKKSKELYALVNSVLSKEIPYSLKDQILRASISINLNFAEGYGRFHKKDKKQFYVNARASLNEVSACFDLFQIHVELSKEVIDKFNFLAEELSKMLSGLINSMKEEK